MGGGRHGNADDSVPSNGRRAYADALAPKFLLTTLGGDHGAPFGSPQTGVVARSTIAFFDRYLMDRRDGLARLRAGAEVPGSARLDGVEK